MSSRKYRDAEFMSDVFDLSIQRIEDLKADVFDAVPLEHPLRGFIKSEFDNLLNSYDMWRRRALHRFSWQRQPTNALELDEELSAINDSKK